MRMRPFPRWVRPATLVVGLMDGLTGLALLIMPATTLRWMHLTPPGAEALDYVRFVGVFVGCVGGCCLVTGRKLGALRTTLGLTRWFRLGAGLFTGVMVATRRWESGWLLVTVTDLALAAGQTWLVATHDDA